MSHTGALAGRIALVTGASRGLGRAIALTFAREGARVAVAARTTVTDQHLPGTIHETVELIRRRGGDGLAVPTNLAKDDEIERLVETVREHWGPVDLLVNNAAVTTGGAPTAGAAVTQDRPPRLTEFPLKAYRLHFQVNVFASYRLMQLVVPGMVAAGRGAIINISTDAAFEPGEGPYPRSSGQSALFAYGSSKAALHNLSQAVAQELAPAGVAVNVLIPSLPIRTPGSELLLDGHHVTRWSTPERFADAAVVLAQADPATTTGQLWFHEDVLEPELGRRGFLSGEIRATSSAPSAG